MNSKIHVQNSPFSFLKWYVFPRTWQHVCFNQLAEANIMTLLESPFLFMKILTDVKKFLKINREAKAKL